MIEASASFQYGTVSWARETRDSRDEMIGELDRGGVPPFGNKLCEAGGPVSQFFTSQLKIFE
jgi:hypothetical protein